MAGDSELAQWRAQRMAQMQGAGSNGKEAQSPEQIEQQRRQQE